MLACSVLYKFLNIPQFRRQSPLSSSLFLSVSALLQYCLKCSQIGWITSFKKIQGKPSAKTLVAHCVFSKFVSLLGFIHCHYLKVNIWLFTIALAVSNYSPPSSSKSYNIMILCIKKQTKQKLQGDLQANKPSARSWNFLCISHFSCVSHFFPFPGLTSTIHHL